MPDLPLDQPNNARPDEQEAHIQAFDFYESSVIGDTIRIYNITSQICSRGLKESLDFIVDTVRRKWAKLVVIDSLRGLKHVLDVEVRDRGTIFAPRSFRSSAAPAS